jgi:mono/diheme cytochrome c family protein
MHGRMNSNYKLLKMLVSLFFVGATALRLSARESSANAVEFLREIQPILTAHCLKCHGSDKSKGGLRLTDLAAATKTLKSGDRAIVQGNPHESELLRRVTSADIDERMPPKGAPLTDRQIAHLKKWIADGAKWPTHWAYTPLVRLRPPSIPAEWQQHVRTPIDAFVLDKLLRRKLTPAPPADKRTLLRRVFFDLIGLPPSAEQMKQFLADASPNAYEKAVDHLLASLRYGEHWARHWLDVAHYADTHGNDHDFYRPNAWPYRDYVIRSFNDDKPYARFVAEQVAGDALFPEDPQATAALGFLAAGPWDHTLMSTIREDTVDHRMGQNLDRDNMVSTVMSTFTSLTVHCARCHDHRFDPVRQREYYGLQAVFAGVDRADRPFDADPEIQAQRTKLLAQKKAVSAKDISKLPALDSPEIASGIAALAREVADRTEQWQALEVASASGAAGTVFAKQDDGSWFVSGARPEKDTFVVTTKTTLKGIRALRLEVLPDKRLPHGGPGRYDNGNFHLSQFRATAQSARGEAKDPVALKFTLVQADHSDRGDIVANTIDGKPNSYWSIHPQYNKSHDAVFEIEAPVGFDGGTTLTIQLEFYGKTGHQIGRFRLWATADAAPKIPKGQQAIPPAIASILNVPAKKQTPQQRRELVLYVVSKKVDEALASLPAQQFVYAATSDFAASGSFKPSPKPRPIHLLVRGDINKPGELISPGATACMTGLAGSLEIADVDDESLRRAALARWLTDTRNVLTWRSIVNRVWHYHFGHGLCNTPNDFGKMGGTPSHPELLDWLAVWFRDDAKGSLKALHRLIVTSATYRQSSQGQGRGQQIDSGNRLLWRMNRTRLTGEMLRDAALAMSDRLDLKMGGPSVVQFKHKGVASTFMPADGSPAFLDYEHFDPDSPENNRRAIYRFVFRTAPDPLMEALDCPDGGAMTPVRTTSSTALQALALLNNAFLIRQSEHIAARVAKATNEPSDQVGTAFRIMLQRSSNTREGAVFAEYIKRHGLANMCHVLLNSNEFIYID